MWVPPYHWSHSACVYSLEDKSLYVTDTTQITDLTSHVHFPCCFQGNEKYLNGHMQYRPLTTSLLTVWHKSLFTRLFWSQTQCRPLTLRHKSMSSEQFQRQIQTKPLTLCHKSMFSELFQRQTQHKPWILCNKSLFRELFQRETQHRPLTSLHMCLFSVLFPRRLHVNCLLLSQGKVPSRRERLSEQWLREAMSWTWRNTRRAMLSDDCDQSCTEDSTSKFVVRFCSTSNTL